jgi:hypothetical protein
MVSSKYLEYLCIKQIYLQYLCIKAGKIMITDGA